MRFNRKTHHRRSIRLRGYDYSHPGAYFITVCTQGKRCLFGQIMGEEMRRNGAGEIVYNLWFRLPERYPTVEVDVFIVMPIHVHGIIQLAGGSKGAPTLGDVVRAFKSTTAIAANRLTGCVGHPLWQRNYYEHIIHNDNELDEIREYILTNPLRWKSDRDNPEAVADLDDVFPWEA